MGGSLLTVLHPVVHCAYFALVVTHELLVQSLKEVFDGRMHLALVRHDIGHGIRTSNRLLHLGMRLTRLGRDQGLELLALNNSPPRLRMIRLHTQAMSPFQSVTEPASPPPLSSRQQMEQTLPSLPFWRRAWVLYGDH